MSRSLSLLFAGVVALTLAGSAKADNDLVRLDGKGDAEVTEARYYGGYHGGGFYRGGYGWGRGYYGGGWGRGYYGGWGRGYYGGYRPYWGVGIGLGYGGYYGGGGYYGSYYSPYYSTPYYYSSPCTCSAAPVVSDTVVSSARPIVPQFPGNSTFPYDGGPRDGFLAPSPTPVKNLNRPLLPRDGLQVSIPAAESGYRFVAFGEQPVEPANRPMVVSSKVPTLRVSYPAYGEPMPTFSAGSMNYNVALR